MSFSFHNLRRRSFQASFLWLTAGLLLATGVIIGYAIFQISGKEVPFDQPSMALEFALDELPIEQELLFDDPKMSFFDKLEIVVFLTDEGESSASTLEALKGSGASQQELAIAQALIESLRGRGDEPGAALMTLTSTEPAPAGAYAALGLFWQEREYYLRAAGAFEIEGKRDDAKDARKAVIHAYFRLEAYTELERLAVSPEYADLLKDDWAMIHFSGAIHQQDWKGILKWFLPAQYAGFHWPILVITIIVGLAWLGFLLFLGTTWQDPVRILLCLSAVVLGMLSTWPTILMVIWQEEFLGLKESSDIIGGLLYFIAGVGLREETMKVLFFIPLLPFLLKRKNLMEALIVACCVGLGFAAEENLNYFHASDAFSGPGRFLTANFFHISATGLTGFALFQVFRSRGRSVGDFATVFGLVVIAHGLYDALISIPALMEYSFFSMTVYIVLMMQLFRVIHFYSAGTRYPVSLSWVFTVLLSVVLATTLGYQIANAGLMLGMVLMVPEFISLAIMVIAFFRFIDEPIHG